VTSGLADLGLCLTCFSFRGTYQGRDHRCQCHRDASWRASEWEGYDIAELIALCKLCARDTMDSGTRWSWLACETCRDVNRKIGAVTGGRRHGALPLGRHSLMNGVSLEVTDQNESHIRGFAEALSQLSHIWTGIFDWGSTERRRLADAAPIEGDVVPLSRWLATFPSSTGHSVDAFCRFTGFELPEVAEFEELNAARRIAVGS
jgi:hypothetical protein